MQLRPHLLQTVAQQIWAEIGDDGRLISVGFPFVSFPQLKASLWWLDRLLQHLAQIPLGKHSHFQNI